MEFKHPLYLDSKKLFLTSRIPDEQFIFKSVRRIFVGRDEVFKIRNERARFARSINNSLITVRLCSICLDILKNFRAKGNYKDVSRIILGLSIVRRNNIDTLRIND